MAGRLLRESNSRQRGGSHPTQTVEKSPALEPARRDPCLSRPAARSAKLRLSARTNERLRTGPSSTPSSASRRQPTRYHTVKTTPIGLRKQSADMSRFKVHLADQLRFIERSCEACDAGDEAEAQRIATSVRVICHQTNRSTSLLTHLGASCISMLSTACSPVGPGVLTAPSNLASLVIRRTEEGATFKSVAPLDNAPIKRCIPFNDWWETEVVCLTAGVRMTRKSLVLAVANQDDGAHVDATLEPDYTAIKSGAGLVAAFHQLVAIRWRSR
jgi:hypothetical protein